MGNNMPTTYEEARQAYNKWKNKDPFSKIPPALLNSADIKDYVRLTGMIYPFHSEDVVGATYTVRLKGMCVYYDEDEKGNIDKHIFCIGVDAPDLPNAINNKIEYGIESELRLKPNSVAFVTLEPVFQVPDYLVLRFNLKISHIYKGLLLGTGPIIDPGFQGRLSIPLHNLTSREYVFHENDEIISLEVTKMSPYRELGLCDNERQEKHKFTKIPPNRQVIQYLQKALGPQDTGGVVSSVIVATNSAKRTAQEAKSTADFIKKAGIVGTVLAIVAVIVAVFSLLIPTYQLIKSVDDTQSQYAIQINELENRIEELERTIQMCPDGGL